MTRPPSHPVDLHTHSNASDGVLTPAALIAYAAERGVRVLGLTDHDTVSGIAEATAAGARHGVEVIPGVELSTQVDGREVHILGYLVDSDDAALISCLGELAARRRTRIERMVARLGEIGVPVSLARVFALSGQGSVGRPHVARAMIEHGYVADVSEAFDHYLGMGRPGYVPRDPFPPEEAVGLVRHAGGVPVLAHPVTTGDIEGTIARLLPAGLLGLEVYYGEYDDEMRNGLRATADRHSLIPTGGSDFHAPGFKPGRDMGQAPVPQETVALLRAATRRRS